MKKRFLTIPALGIVFCSVISGQLTGTSSSIADPQSAVGVDSIIQGPTEGELRGQEASEAYKKLKFMEYEGEQESVLYNTAYDVNSKALEALQAADDSEQASRARNILKDVHQLLMQGAIYHSGAGNSAETTRFAQAFIDTETLPAMSVVDFKTTPQVLAMLSYSAAYGAVNSGDLDRAKRYFETYLSTGEQQARENVVLFYGQACVQTKDWDKGLEVLGEGVSQYPLNERIVTMALQCAIEGGRPEQLQNLLDRALALNPNDEQLLDIQAKLYSTNRDFRKALDIYLQIAEKRPQSLENTRRMATCYYNLGAQYYNQSIMEADEKAAKRASRQSQAYFNSAAESLEQLLSTTPSDIKYLRALAQTYAALGEKERFDEVNSRLLGFGDKGVVFNSMPVMIEGDSFSSAGGSAKVGTVPSYAEFARPFIEERLGTWAQRGEFEKLEDYKKRVAEGGGVDEYKSLNKAAEKEYLERYGRQLVLDDLKRSDYDVDNETYMITTPYGNAVLKVPYKNREAELFKSGWESARIRTPKFMIKDDKVALAEITFIVNGKKYSYNAADAADYRTPEVYVDINGILAAASSSEGKAAPTATRVQDMVFTPSDVDENIPVTTRKADNLYAVIIANEHYNNADDVFGALHDGQSFHQYCVKTLGVPEHQAVLLANATGNQVRDAVETLAKKVKGTGENAEVIFYYAGHGLPDDATKEAYLLPSDGNPLTTSTLIPMKDLYRSLGNMGAGSVSVFIDACFSGSSRNNTSVKKGERGVVMKPKEVEPEGNMFILTAASGQQTALPYTQKHHGLFTYFLLKKLQESKGNATLRQISDYVKKEVESASNRINGKEQTPVVSVSGKLASTWESKKLKP